MSRSHSLPILIALGLFLVPDVTRAEPVKPHHQGPQVLPGLGSLRKARAGGKYEMLLRQFKAPQDAASYGDFRDLGKREVKEYAGQDDLPAGYWVYVYPHWYVWRDLVVTPKVKRNYGPEQATGAPDTPQPGDLPTAWASQSPDGQDEWLLLEYAEPVRPASVVIHESHCPGALVRVTVFNLDGAEVEVWKGKDPVAVGSVKGVAEIPVPAAFKTNRVKLYLDSRAVPGYNEIDAVGLREPSGKVHWAAAAEASSTYALNQGRPVMILQAAGAQPLVMPPPAAPPPAADPQKERLDKLEAEIKELKKTIQELQEALKRK